MQLGNTLMVGVGVLDPLCISGAHRMPEPYQFELVSRVGFDALQFVLVGVHNEIIKGDFVDFYGPVCQFESVAAHCAGQLKEAK